MMMRSLRILNAEPDRYSPEAQSILESLGSVENGPLTNEQMLATIGNFDVLIVRLAHQVDEQLLTHGQRLKVIVTATTGLDHIDQEAARAHRITILSLRGEVDFLRSIPATAEHTWGLLLAVVRHIPAACNSVLEGHWDRNRFRGNDLAGKTLGLLGLGRIGLKVAGYGLSFGMKVIAYDPHPEITMAGVQMVDTMDELFKRSQVLSVHVLLTNETLHIIGDHELSLLPPEAFLVNTSRGEIIDEQALITALDQKRLVGAALDVISGERLPDQGASSLIEYARSHENLIITPHIGGATYESMAATEVFMARKLCKFLGQELGQ